MKYVSWACVWLIAAAIIADDEQVPDPAADVRSVSQRADGQDAGVAAAAGHDWPGIRGPLWNGHADETGLADSWPPEGPPVLWTRALGQGYSAFVAWSNRVATQYQSLSGQFVICLNANTGSTLWEYRYDWPYDPAGLYPGPRATPMYKDGFLYFAGPAGLIGCLDSETGTHIWSVELPQVLQCEITGFGYACSPTVIDGLVLLPVGGSDASMVALDAKTGQVRWHSGSQPGSYAPAFPITFRGRRLVLGYLENALVCHDRGTGELLWTHRLSRGYDEHSSWPIYQEPFLWISSPFQSGGELLELTDRPGQHVGLVSMHPLMSNDIFSSVLVDGAIYGFDVHESQARVDRSTRGMLRCLDFLTGAEHWSVGDRRPHRIGDKLPDDDSWVGHASIIAADGKLILFNDLGELILAKATTERFQLLGRVSVLGGEICWTQPALSDGRLFVRNQSRAACLFLRDPAELQREQHPTVLTVADIPQQAYFDWASVVLGFRPEAAFDLPPEQWLRRWYQISLFGIMGGWLLVSIASRHLPGSGRISAERRETVYWVMVFLTSASGTTWLSLWYRDFIFTWPVAVFATYQSLIDRVVLSRKHLTTRDRLRSGSACLIFVASCGIYYSACQRLSLAFELVFLTGFAAALPFSLIGRRVATSVRWGFPGKILFTALAFTAFYWSSVEFLNHRVQ